MKDAKETRAKLIKAGIAHFEKMGAKGFSLRKITSQCGLTLRAPYNYFADSKEFLSVIRSEVWEGWMKQLDAIPPDVLTSSEKRLLWVIKSYKPFYIKYVMLLNYIDGKFPRTEYWIAKDGVIRKTTDAYPLTVERPRQSGQEKERFIREHMVLGAMVEGMPYFLLERSAILETDSGEKEMESGVRLILDCMEDRIRETER